MIFPFIKQNKQSFLQQKERIELFANNNSIGRSTSYSINYLMKGKKVKIKFIQKLTKID